MKHFLLRGRFQLEKFKFRSVPFKEQSRPFYHRHLQQETTGRCIPTSNMVSFLLCCLMAMLANNNLADSFITSGNSRNRLSSTRNVRNVFTSALPATAHSLSGATETFLTPPYVSLAVVGITVASYSILRYVGLMASNCCLFILQYIFVIFTQNEFP